jgi:hypothetical protein
MRLLTKHQKVPVNIHELVLTVGQVVVCGLDMVQSSCSQLQGPKLTDFPLCPAVSTDY